MLQSDNLRFFPQRAYHDRWLHAEACASCFQFLLRLLMSTGRDLVFRQQVLLFEHLTLKDETLLMQD